MVMVKGNGAFFADIFAPVSKTSAAGICNLITCGRTFVTSNIDNLNDIGVFFIATHCNTHSL